MEGTSAPTMIRGSGREDASGQISVLPLATGTRVLAKTTNSVKDSVEDPTGDIPYGRPVGNNAPPQRKSRKSRVWADQGKLMLPGS